MTVDLALECQWTLRLGSAYFPAAGSSSDERQAFYDEITRYSAGRIPLTLNARKEGSRSRMHWRNEQGADARNKTHTKIRKKMKDNQQTHLKATSHCARALVFGERRRLSSLVPTAIGRVLD